MCKHGRDWEFPALSLVNYDKCVRIRPWEADWLLLRNRHGLRLKCLISCCTAVVGFLKELMGFRDGSQWPTGHPTKK